MVPLARRSTATTTGSLTWFVLVVVVGAFFHQTPTVAADFVGVVPIPSELTAICGPYALPTPSFTCRTFVNGTGYSNCLNQPFQCECQPQAPPQFQQPFQPPCLYNYGVFPCTGLPEAQLFCGPNAVGCTQRCDYLGNCYAPNVCTCAPGYTMPTNPQYCSYTYQADVCITGTAFAGQRDVTTCGVFAASASYLCPTNTSFDSANCRPICVCKDGTGPTPAPNAEPCDGMDRFCNIADVFNYCGPGAVNCTKRCQYNDLNALNLPGICVVRPGSCVVPPLTAPPPAACTSSVSLARCGPATTSCTQHFDTSGLPTTVDCTCSSFGFAQGSLPCQAWSSYVTVSQTICNATCGPGFLTVGTGCQSLRVWTPDVLMLPCPGQCTQLPCLNCTFYSLIQRQRFWVALNQILVFDPAAVTTIASASAFQTVLATGVQLTRTLDMLECVCDTGAWISAWSYINFLTVASLGFDFQQLMINGGSGVYDVRGVHLGTNMNVNVIRIDFSRLGKTAIIYPGSLNSTFGAFYSFPSCRGPQIQYNMKLAYNQFATPPQPGLALLQQTGPGVYSLGINIAGTPLHTCSLVAAGVTTFAPPDPVGAAETTLNAYPFDSFFVTYKVPKDGSMASFSCPNNQFIDSQFGLSRQGQVYEVAQNGPIFMSNSFYVDTLNIGALDGTGMCGGANRGHLIVFDANTTNGQPDLPGILSALTIPSYLIPTLQAVYSAYTVYPWAQTRGSNSYDSQSYGPINLVEFPFNICACNRGWGGTDCHANSQCSVCFDGVITCPPSAFTHQCAPSTSDPEFKGLFQGTFATNQDTNGPASVVYRYDLQVVALGQQYLNLINCAYTESDDVTYGSPACDMNAYMAAAQRMCGFGTPVYGTNGQVSCICKPGYTFSSTFDPISCYAAGYSPVTGISNCDGRKTAPITPGCALNSTLVNTMYANGYGPLTTQCYCGGHGEIDSTGSCVCDAGYLKDSQGCCSIFNVCPAPNSAVCANFSLPFMHVLFCNITQFAPANWICTPATSDGYWTGPCCTIFVPYTQCAHGGVYRPGEVVYNYTNGQLVAASYIAGLQCDPAHPNAQCGVNPDGMICVCNPGEWTGAYCNTTSCPTGPNGLVCSGQSKCNNGQCMRDNACDNTDAYGCACQYNITKSCKGGSSTNLVCSSTTFNPRGQCVTANTEQLSIGCQCLPPFTGQFCETSFCGPTNCNELQGGGKCIPNPNNATQYECLCNVDDPVQCLIPVGCLFAGPTCASDVTLQCGVIAPQNDAADECNDEGTCVVYSAGPPAVANCTCHNGWGGPKCQVEPCIYPCEPNGRCVTDGINPPNCECNPHWSPDGVVPSPCSVQDCGANAHPSGEDCVCNDPTLAYSAPWIIDYHPCTQRACNSTFGVICGQVNCLIPPTTPPGGLAPCQDASGACEFGCTSPPQWNTCNNGVCACHWSSKFNPVTQQCDSICALPPFTTQVLSTTDVHGNVIFQACVCNLATGFGYSAADFCFEPICMNGGNWIAPAGAAAGGCRCEPGWQGDRCELDFCNNHGIYANASSNVCSCFFPWTGDQCQTVVCANGGSGVVNPQTGGGMCQCSGIYYGTTCQFSRCLHGTPNPNGQTCDCFFGWGSTFCDVENCNLPNVEQNGDCVCDPSYYGPSCLYHKCNVGLFNTTKNQCVCGGVAVLRDDGTGFLNCTGNQCGAFGEPDTKLTTCFCEEGTEFVPNSMFNPGISFNCIPICLNGGFYRNTVPIGCNCPVGTFLPFCSIPGMSSSISSSTGHAVSGSSSSTGQHISSSSSTGGHANSSTGHISAANSLLGRRALNGQSGMSAVLLNAMFMPGCCVGLIWLLGDFCFGSDWVGSQSEQRRTQPPPPSSPRPADPPLLHLPPPATMDAPPLPPPPPPPPVPQQHYPLANLPLIPAAAAAPANDNEDDRRYLVPRWYPPQPSQAGQGCGAAPLPPIRIAKRVLWS